MSLRNPERGLFTVKGLIFSLGLIASFIFVGVFYAGLIRPAANKAATAALYGVDSGSTWANLFVILKDMEQQVCISLFIWGIMILAYKFHQVRSEAKVVDLFDPAPGIESRPEMLKLKSIRGSINRKQAQELANEIENHGKDAELGNKILPYVLARGLERYHMTGSVPESTETIMGRIGVAAEQQESELSVLRYLVWAIPSIGFIGTVRGIGVALRRANEALEGDISGVTSALGVAFNSTLVALIISILLMLLIHLLQGNQEGLILRLQTFCREQLLDKLYDRSLPDDSKEPASPEKTEEA
ncbi:MotA/TolQ/ExbB proton channel family protein [Coraliomargarita parva]|uniref:MotA/TolQ/ExbB proton channel family protein n=1 Tax=Coraliomargarita parva TaxID=3014050 RepID=UPI0022B2D7D5|nr:MotA/TolQ/ExbB proton channel family protein [Coraliomargarita parva]